MLKCTHLLEEGSAWCRVIILRILRVFGCTARVTTPAGIFTCDAMQGGGREFVQSLGAQNEGQAVGHAWYW